jgi:AbiTii
VKTRTDRLLGEIEAGALDSSTPIADVLRKVIALGGKAGSTELRDWATRELNGYRPGDELPAYRQITAPLQLDMVNAAYIMKGQTISPLELPDIAHETVTNQVNLYMGIGEIEQFVRQCPPGEVIKLSPPGAQELVVIMNQEMDINGHVQRLYWSISPVPLSGVVDQVRTALVNLVAEISDNMPEGAETPPAEVATNAVNFLVSGERHKINFAAPQASSGSTAVDAPPADEHPRRWVKTAAAVVVGVLTIIGVFFAILQAQGWSF